jgi:hypothetical protein
MLLTSTTVNGAVSNDSNNNITMSVGNTVIANVNSSGIYFESGKKAIYTGAVLNVWTTSATNESLSVNDANAGSTTWTASSLDLTITPAFSNSKFLIMSVIKYTTSINAVYRVYDVTAGSNIIGAASGSRIANEGGPFGSDGSPWGAGGKNPYGTTDRTSVVYYTPGSGAASRRFRIDFIGVNATGTVYLGRNSDATNAAYNSFSPSTFTIMEIAV